MILTETLLPKPRYCSGVSVGLKPFLTEILTMDVGYRKPAGFRVIAQTWKLYLLKHVEVRSLPFKNPI